MTIDWANFTPWSSVAGGLLIGLAAAMFLLFNGRIAGISGVLAGLLRPASNDMAWRIAFLLGMIVAPYSFARIASLPDVQIDANAGILVVAGLLVGLGTRCGSGRASGHGVCGLSRRSPRSLAATASFMLAGFVTVYIMYHLIG